MISVVIPTRSGGPLLERAARAVLGQRTECEIELVLVDSGSSPSELERLRALGATSHSIASSEFDHGATRDLGARLARGRVLVFLNQDAQPSDDHWLERLTAPFFAPNPPAAVQGGIREFPGEELERAGRGRFFWDSCGPRFYFTSESTGWISRHGGVGFSTVNCAIARWAWEELPFGRAAILEDKIWQKGALARGWRIDEAPDAAVWHTHDYDLSTLFRRCASEGYGWKLLGETYALGAARGDLLGATTWKEWRRGLRSGEMRSLAEVSFPVARPLALWWGNRWAGRAYL